MVAIYGYRQRLAYYKFNDKKETPLNAGEFGIGVQDVIFHKGNALYSKRQLLVFENIGGCALAPRQR